VFESDIVLGSKRLRGGGGGGRGKGVCGRGETFRERQLVKQLEKGIPRNATMLALQRTINAQTILIR